MFSGFAAESGHAICELTRPGWHAAPSLSPSAGSEANFLKYSCPMDLPAGVPTSTYTYAGTGYENPHAVTQIGNGTATTTYSYDNNGNLTSAGTGTATTTYTYDYANHLTAIFANNSTTTFGYDAFGQRVYQIASTTATTTYPFKFFSIASTTKSGANYATSTEYIFNGDTLLSTVDQAFKNGAATGTAAVSYVHPDHLGSTHIVTDANQNLVQTLDFYPYGETRISNSTSTNEKRKFIGQFSDDTNLSYLQARYYNPNQAQFISQDPVFWEIGLTQDGKDALSNSQALNSYGYASDNPITNKDPMGRWYVQIGIDKSINLFGYQVMTGVAGIRINGQGAVLYSSGGGGAGGLINLPVQFNSGDINVFSPDVTTAREATYALGPSLTGSYEGKFDPSAPLKIQNGRATFGITAGDRCSLLD
jgi:RHS repeat-associated protein